MDRQAKARSAAGCAHLTPAQFAERFASAWRTLWCIASASLNSRDGAEDVVQEAAIIALGKLDEFDADSNFTAWMGRIVRYVALNAGRRHARRRGVGGVEMDRLEGSAHDEARNTDLVLDARGRFDSETQAFDDHLLGALRSLDETPRACLLLRVVRDLSYREISEVLEIPEGTAMSHVHRARKTLGERLTPVVVSMNSDEALQRESSQL